ncbi:RNA pseudouridine synthase [bacterium]|nr:RNA pseudouridine synthase [bacterium]
MEAGPPVVLLEQDGLIVVDKPAGLPSTGRTLEDPGCLQWRLEQARGRPVWAIHQLDAETSGVILFAARKSLVEPTVRRMRPPLGRKIYLAVCRGTPDFTARSIREPIGRRETARGSELSVSSRGRPSRTDVRVIASSRDACLVRASLATGRTHQVRIHLAHVGLPVVGETRYAPPPATPDSRLALHSWTIALAPTPERPRLVVTSPPPGDLVRLCARLGLDLPASR